MIHSLMGEIMYESGEVPESGEIKSSKEKCAHGGVNKCTRSLKGFMGN
jgi:hypothetical protein